MCPVLFSALVLVIDSLQGNEAEEGVAGRSAQADCSISLSPVNGPHVEVFQEHYSGNCYMGCFHYLQNQN